MALSKLTNEEIVMLNLLFYSETLLMVSKNVNSKKIKQKKVKFEDDPISIILLSSSNSSAQKIELKRVKKIFSTVPQNAFKFSISIIFTKDKLIGIKSEDEITLFFQLKSEYQIWKDVLNILMNNAHTSIKQLLTKKSRMFSKAAYKTIDMSKLGSGNSLTINQSSVMSVSMASENAYNVYAFGNNEWGQLCLESEKGQVTFPKVSLALLSKKVKAVSLGWNHIAILIGQNDVLQTGNRIGTGYFKDSNKTKLMDFGDMRIDKKCFVEISCGHCHTLLLDDEGKVYSWGSNMFGQLGRDSGDYSHEPQLVEGLEDAFVTQIGCGDYFSAALTDKGKLYTWGYGLSGALGHGDTENRTLPKLVATLRDESVELLAVGSFHIIVSLKNSSNVFCWGWNGCGQLGLGDFKDRLEPTKMTFAFNGDIRNISCGTSHSGVVVNVRKLNTSCVYMFGSNKSGQLGIGNKGKLDFVPVPTVIGQIILVSKMCCGACHTVLLSEDKRVYSTGCNVESQLGVNDYVDEIFCSDSTNEAKMLEERLGSMKSMRKSTMKMYGSSGMMDSSVTIQSTTQTGGIILAPEFFRTEFRELIFFQNKEVCDVVCAGNGTILLSKKIWIEDSDIDSCMGKFTKNCRKDFNLVNRKHHCRSCGGIFCSACSSRYVPVSTTKNATKTHRVCNRCYESR